MRKGIAAAAAAGALVLTSCSTATTKTTSTSTTSTSTTSTSTTTRATVTAPVIPSPDAAQQRALLATLRQVDPGLGDERSVDRARSTCMDVRDGKPAETVVRNTRMRFEGGTVPKLSDQQVQAIIRTIMKTFCR